MRTAIDLCSNQSPEKAYINGEDFRCGVKAVHSDKHSGILPGQASFITVRGDIAVTSMTSGILAGEEGCFTMIRIFNPSVNAQNAGFVFAGAIKNAYGIDFEGNILKELDFRDDTVSFYVEPKKIVTLAVKL